MTLLRESHHCDFSLYFLAHLTPEEQAVSMYDRIVKDRQRLYAEDNISLLTFKEYTHTHTWLFVVVAICCGNSDVWYVYLHLQEFDGGATEDFVSRRFGPVIELTHNHGTETDPAFR